MIYIVYTQKDKHMEDILFNLNLFRKQAKKYESIMNKVFKVYFAVKILYAFALSFFQVSCTNMIDIPDTYAVLTMSMSIINLVIKSIVFMALYYCLYHYGKYVYQTIHKRLLIFFALDFFSYAFMILLLTV